jgi:hypothetical protein
MFVALPPPPCSNRRNRDGTVAFLPYVRPSPLSGGSEVARLDVVALRHYLGIQVDPLYCTRTVSKLVRTYSDRHDLKDNLLEFDGQGRPPQRHDCKMGAGLSGA